MPIKEAKFTSNNLFADKTKRIDFWLNSGIYEKEPHEQVELRVSLIEYVGTAIQEYIVKSTTRPISSDHLAYEQRILDPNTKTQPATAGNTANNATGSSESAWYAQNGELYNFYKILDVYIEATAAEIENAYIRQQTKWQAAMWHQERSKDVDIQGKLALASFARNVLINPERRARYDNLLLGKAINKDISNNEQVDVPKMPVAPPQVKTDVPEKLTFIDWLKKLLGY